MTIMHARKIEQTRLQSRPLGGKHHAYLVDHIALWMPMLVLAVSVNLHKLLQDRGPAACALDSVAEGVVVVTKDLAIMFIVRVLRPKNGRADRARKVLDMVLVIQSGNVAPSQGLTAGVADQVQAPEVIALTEWVLLAVSLLDGKEL